MYPSLPFRDLGDGLNPHLQRSRDLRQPVARSVSGSDIKDDFGSHRPLSILDRTGASVSVNDNRVLMVLGIRRPLEIARSIVLPIMVKVGDLWKTVRIWDESERNRSMNANVSRLSSFVAKTQAKVSVLILVGRQHLLRSCDGFRLTAPNVGDGSTKAPYATKVAGLVKSLVPANGQPFLSFGHIGLLFGSDTQTMVYIGRKVNFALPVTGLEV